jgi:hypothetical protein
VYSSNFLIDCLFKLKRAEGFKECFERYFGFLWNVFRFENSLIGDLRSVMALEETSVDTLFGLKLHGKNEEVVIEAPLTCVKVIESPHNTRIFEPTVTELLADMRPVLPLDMGIVILSMRS